MNVPTSECENNLHSRRRNVSMICFSSTRNNIQMLTSNSQQSRLIVREYELCANANSRLRCSDSTDTSTRWINTRRISRRVRKVCCEEMDEEVLLIARRSSATIHCFHRRLQNRKSTSQSKWNQRITRKETALIIVGVAYGWFSISL